jgi:hypothetical protein
MIITSVIPQQFPMQMAVAVNVALMALMKVACLFSPLLHTHLTPPPAGRHHVHRALPRPPRRQSRALPVRQNRHSHHRPACAPRRCECIVRGHSTPSCAHQRQRSGGDSCSCSMPQRCLRSVTRGRRVHVGWRPHRAGCSAGCVPDVACLSSSSV